MAEDIDLGNGMMLRRLPEGSYTYPKAIPTEETDSDPFAIAAARVRQGVKGRERLPVDEPTPYKPPNYVMEPDLLERQQGMHLPTGIGLDDAGRPFNKETGAEVPVVRRPNVLPIAVTPDGLTLAMPKVLDIFGNMMGGVAGAPVKGAEVLLGSGPVRKVLETPKVEGPFYSALERAVDNSKVGKADAQQWLGYLKNQPGVKSEELSTVLGGMEGQLTKQQVQELVKQNKVELKEVVKGELSDKEILKQSGIRKEDWNKMTQSQREVIKTGFPITPTKYHGYQLPGGEAGSYKETLLTLPEKPVSGYRVRAASDMGGGYEVINSVGDRVHMSPRQSDAMDWIKSGGSESYRSSHWDEPNILAHIRHNDRMVDGKKTLHIEEIQSDWHQKGRNEGYKLSDKQRKDLDTIENKLTTKLTEAEIGNPDIDNVLKVAVDKKVISADEARNYKDYVKGENSTVPDAPFKKNWDELALKRMLHKAADEGYEGISWTPGEAQAARYDLSKQVSGIHWQPSPADKNASLVQITPTAGNNLKLQVDKSGKVVMGFPSSRTHQWEGKNLSDVIGKEHAEKILGKAEGSLEGEGLKIGGEGMKSFYDKMLVDKANALAKKYGAKVEQRTIPFGGKETYLVQKDGVNSQPFTTHEEARKFAKDNGGVIIKDTAKGPIHYLPITPELRAKAKEGFPLFSQVPVTVPVQGNPFEKDKPKGQVEPGNIDLTKRPIVKNKDGSISTVRTIGIEMDGQQILIPTVSDDGRIMSDREAVDNFKKTGKHLGVFDNIKDANDYAENLHNDQDKMYSKKYKLTPVPFDPFNR